MIVVKKEIFKQQIEIQIRSCMIKLMFGSAVQFLDSIEVVRQARSKLNQSSRLDVYFKLHFM